IAEQPLMVEKMKNATRVTPVHSASDFSYRNMRLAGDRWLLAGDAAGFIDPVFSSGVFLAIMSAEKAADALEEVLRDESQRSRAFKKYSHDVNRIMDIYLTFVNSWYNRGKEFLEVFLNPTETMQIAAAVNAVLAGNEGKSLAIKWRMWLFYFFVYIQRFVALSPRLSLIPKRASASALRINREFTHINTNVGQRRNQTWVMSRGSFVSLRVHSWFKMWAVGVNRPYLLVAALLLTACATTSTHQFAEPKAVWQTRT